MDEKKRKTTTMSFDRGDIDPAIKDEFYRICKCEGWSRGELINGFMESVIRNTFGPGADTVISISRGQLMKHDKGRKELGDYYEANGLDKNVFLFRLHDN